MNQSNKPGNGEIALIFEEIAGFMEIKGENPYKICAYRNAVETLQTLAEPAWLLAEEHRLMDVPGFGEAICAKINDILQTGTTPLYERLKDEVPSGLLDILALPKVGAKVVIDIWREAKIDNVEDLRAVAGSAKIDELSPKGKKAVLKVMEAIARDPRDANRVILSSVGPTVRSLINALDKQAGLIRIEAAGSFRRGVETVRDINLVGASTDFVATLAAFVAQPQVSSILVQSESMARVALHSGMEADLHLSEPSEFSAILRYFTGSKKHNEHLNRIAEEQGFSLTERGLFREDKPALSGSDEDGVYIALGLSPIEIELREDSGEIEAAQSNTLPTLIVESDIKGDVHAHTTASDGTSSIETMAAAAKERCYEYMAITDHSFGLTIANGLNPDRLRAQIAEIRALEDKLGIRVFSGSEVEIKADGSMDYDDELLSLMDFVIGSTHRFNNQDYDTQTARIIKAMENPHVDLIAHPTARMINKRAGFDADWEAVFKAAVRTGTAMEINASPPRFDFGAEHAREACRHGVKIIINTDAHSTPEYGLISYGITIARRAWLTPKNVLNTLPLADFEAWLKR